MTFCSDRGANGPPPIAPPLHRVLVLDVAVGMEAHTEARLQIRGKSQEFFCLSSPRRGRDIQGERADVRVGVANDDGVGLCAATDVC